MGAINVTNEVIAIYPITPASELLHELSRHAGLALGGADVFVNVAGGVDLSEPAADLAVMLPYLACYMGHTDLRGTQYYLRLTADAYPEVMAKANIRFGYVIPAVIPAPTEDES